MWYKVRPVLEGKIFFIVRSFFFLLCWESACLFWKDWMFSNWWISNHEYAGVKSGTSKGIHLHLNIFWRFTAINGRWCHWPNTYSLPCFPKEGLHCLLNAMLAAVRADNEQGKKSHTPVSPYFQVILPLLCWEMLMHQQLFNDIKYIFQFISKEWKSRSSYSCL